LRRGNFYRQGDAIETINRLKQQYSGFEEATSPSAARVQILAELRNILLVHKGAKPISEWDDPEFNSILRDVNNMQEELNQTIGEDHRKHYDQVFDEIRQCLAEDGHNFVLDGLSMINSQLPNTSEAENPIVTQQTTTENALEEIITQDWQQNQMRVMTAKNKRPLSVYNNEDEQYAQIISGEELPVANIWIWKALGGLTMSGYAYMVAAGTGTMTALVGVPLLAHTAAKMFVAHERYYDDQEYIKDIYLRKEDMKLDVYLYKAGAYTRVLNAVQPSEVEILDGENVEVTGGENVPFNYEGKGMNLTQLKKKGLPSSMIVVNIAGKSYFMHQNYYVNRGYESVLA
jgi:hypothetical protein